MLLFFDQVVLNIKDYVEVHKMNPFQVWYKRIMIASVVIAITLQSIIYNEVLVELANEKNEVSLLLVDILSASTLYVSIQKIFIFAYEKFVWKIFLKRYNISGTWYHEFRDNSESEYRRIGKTEIFQDVNNIYISGYNLNQDFEIRKLSMWKSKACYIDEHGCITFAYVNSRAGINENDKVYNKGGYAEVEIKCDKHKNPIKIIGIYQDSYPACHRGSAIWVKNVDWKSQIDELSIYL